MYSSPARLSRVRHFVTAVAVLGIIGGTAVIIAGALRWRLESAVGLIAIGGTIVGASIVTISTTRLALKIESNTFRLYAETRELLELLSHASRTLDKIAENTSISEAAKSIAHRVQERHALREAIYEEIRREDYEGAFHLIDDLETRLGYGEEAAKLREENKDAYTAAFRSKLAEVIEHVDSLFGKQQWPQAKREIERLEKLMPSEPRIAELWHQLSERRETYKQTLLRDWKAAAAENNVERAMTILKEIDEYLTREEARAMESGAREMFKERLAQLGLQFQFAVNEKRWRDALECGVELADGSGGWRPSERASRAGGHPHRRRGHFTVRETRRTDGLLNRLTCSGRIRTPSDWFRDRGLGWLSVHGDERV